MAPRKPAAAPATEELTYETVVIPKTEPVNQHLKAVQDLPIADGAEKTAAAFIVADEHVKKHVDILRAAGALREPKTTVRTAVSPVEDRPGYSRITFWNRSRISRNRPAA